MVCPYCLNDVEFKVGEGAVRQYSCPQCNEAVPLRYVHDYKRYPPVVMAIIGLKGHGKTCYLASLFNELERTAEREWSEFSISALDEEGLRVLREKQESLLGNRLPESTPKVFPKPVVLRLSKVPGYGNWHLLCYDISGEVFLKALEVREYGGYLSRVDEVIWLLDIKGADEKRLDGRGRINANALIEFMVRYDQAVMELGGDLKRQRLILVLTKGDQLVDELGSRLKDYLEREGWDREEAEVVSREVRNWLRKNGYNNFVNEIENRFLQVRYTILSALGSSPRGKTKEIEVRPRRVKDPLLMILTWNSDRRRGPQKIIIEILRKSKVLIQLINSFLIPKQKAILSKISYVGRPVLSFFNRIGRIFSLQTESRINALWRNFVIINMPVLLLILRTNLYIKKELVSIFTILSPLLYGLSLIIYLGLLTLVGFALLGGLAVKTGLIGILGLVLLLVYLLALALSSREPYEYPSGVSLAYMICGLYMGGLAGAIRALDIENGFVIFLVFISTLLLLFFLGNLVGSGVISSLSGRRFCLMLAFFTWIIATSLLIFDIISLMLKIKGGLK